MIAAGTGRPYARSLWALALALILAVRLLSPAGFMPAFERGSVTIVACPDAGPAVPAMAAHDHADHSKNFHQSCPYAAASALGGTITDPPLLAAVLAPCLAVLVGCAFAFLERHRARERPPLRGPPLPA